MNGDYENDVYTVRIRLAYLIPEFLPIRGKRARVYYHGIAPFCTTCYTPGHQRHECQAQAVTWGDYINSLRDTGIPNALFEPLENSFASNASLNLPTSSTPRADSVNRADMLNLLQELAQNLNHSIGQPQAQAQAQVQDPNAENNAPPPPPPINPIPRPVTRSLRSLGDISGGQHQAGAQIGHQALGQAPRGRGRGRGRPSNSPNFPNFGNVPVLNSSFNPVHNPVVPSTRQGAAYLAAQEQITDQLFEDINRGRSVRGRLRAQNHAFGVAPPQYYRGGYRR
jgi:hypothetical protein